MIGGDLIGPAVVAAAVSGIVTTIGFFINRSTTLATHKEKLAADQSLAERRFGFEKELAERKVRLDMQAQDRRRRQELAEELIAGFHEVADIMRSVRSPFGYQGEGSSRERGENETPDETRRLNARFVIHERFNKHREAVSRLASREYRAVAWFGTEIREPFEKLHRAINEVFLANDMLSEEAGYSPDEKSERDLRVEWRRARYGTGDESDKIAAQIRGAIQQVEQICRPVLEAAT